MGWLIPTLRFPIRYSVTMYERRMSSATMKAWQMYEYGGPEKLQLSTTATVPHISKPTEMLVEVYAASVNPIDSDMLGGYGSKTFEPVKKLSGNKALFPMVLGRDYSGVVVDVGQGIPNSVFKPGDEVWGVINPFKETKGSHAEYVVADASQASHKPKTITHFEAASLPYVACTAWSAIVKSAGLTQENVAGKHVLILGAAGGVGSYSVQLLRAWKAHVTATCKSADIEQVMRLGADVAIDYQKHDVAKELKKLDRFDFILDCVQKKPQPQSVWMNLLKTHSNATYVTLNGPILQNNDRLGFPFGFIKSAVDYLPNTLKYKTEGKNVAWGLFYPSKTALSTTASLIEKGKMKPVVDRVYPFSDVPKVFAKVGSRHGRGKSVIDIKS